MTQKFSESENLTLQQDLITQDLRHIWHPCTQMSDHFSKSELLDSEISESNLPLIPIARGKGAVLIDFNGKKYIDCVSSWWVNLFGHCNKKISNALQKQAKELEHTLLAGFTHSPIIKLSQKLCQFLHPKFQKLFFADNGSSAIEVALKMAFHAQFISDSQNLKTKFISLENGYHGETIGALSVGDVGIYTDVYRPILLENLKIPAPNILEPDSEKAALENLAQILKNHNDIAAFIIEPLVQCAGAMRMHSADFVARAVELCHANGVLVIFDEIAVGFGRAGSMFAYEQTALNSENRLDENLLPDFLCLSKGITGGFLPLSVVATSEEIYQKFYAPYSEHKAFLHSHSYTGNALACACAVATLEIFEQNDVIAQNAKKSAYILKTAHKKLNDFIKAGVVANLRQRGMILAFEVVENAAQNVGEAAKNVAESGQNAQKSLDNAAQNVENGETQNAEKNCAMPNMQKNDSTRRIGLHIYRHALKQGLILRPLGNTIYFMPPYIISKKQIRKTFGTLAKILKMI